MKGILYRLLIFKNRPIRNKNCLRRPCLSMDRDKMSKLYRKPSIDASYQIAVHLGKRFQRRRFFFRNQPIRNKNGLWWPCLLTDQDEIKKKSSPKPLDQMNQNLVGSIYGRFSIKMLISSRFVNKHGHHRQFLFLIG
jgi:hypothetical protein